MESQTIPLKVIEGALKEYDLAILSDPRNTEAMRNSRDWPRMLAAIRRDAMAEALREALVLLKGE